LSTLTADEVIALLSNYTKQTGASLDVLLVGALALQAYGYQHRLTRDVDAEVAGSIEALAEFLDRQHIPADLTTNFSSWSIVAMPPGYRERAPTCLRATVRGLKGPLSSHWWRSHENLS
jgi:hypothetical protein